MKDEIRRAEIGLAGPSDIERIIAVDKAAGQMFAGTGLLPDEELEDHVPDHVLVDALRTNMLDVARLGDGTVVGFTLVSVRAGTLYLDQVSVHPDAGKCGIGTRLMRNIEQKAIELDLAEITLSTFRDVPWNAPFYASLGYKPIKRGELLEFMLDIENAQRRVMDVTKRVFMRKRVRKALFRGRTTK